MENGAYNPPTRTGLAMEGIRTFLGLPYVAPTKENLSEAGVRAAFMGIPYEGKNLANIFRAGCSGGPRGVRESSTHLTPYNWELDTDIVSHYNLRDCGDIPVVHTDGDQTRELIERYTADLLEADVLPVFVGGDHSIPVPVAHALSKRVDRMGFLVLDSHLDTSEEMYGDRYTNCSIHPRLLEFGNIDPKNIAIVGHHGNSIRPQEVDWIKEKGINVYFQNDIWERGIEEVINEALDHVWRDVDAVHVSFDVDVMDAAYMPGTTSSEPGGLTSRELLKAARLIGARGVDLLDVCELAPVWDSNEISTRLVVYYIINILAANAWHEKSGLPMGEAAISSPTQTPDFVKAKQPA
jgi:agmatinase